MPTARLSRSLLRLAVFILTYIIVSSLDLVACIQALLPLVWFVRLSKTLAVGLERRRQAIP
jgi:hypothetical protein